MSAQRQADLRAEVASLTAQIEDPTLGHLKTTKQGRLIAAQAELDRLANAATEIPVELIQAATDAPTLSPEIQAAIDAPTPVEASSEATSVDSVTESQEQGADSLQSLLS